MPPQPNTPCPHCGSPVSAGEPTAPYCCTGCRGAHRLLTDAGLGRYYSLRAASGVSVGPAAPVGGGVSLAWLEPLLEARPPCDGIRRLELDLQGIQCGACVWLIEQLFRRAPGGMSIDVNPGTGRMTLVYKEEHFPIQAWLTDLDHLGYKAGPPSRAPDPGDTLLLRFGICAAIAMNGMIFSAAHYFGLTADVDPQLFALFGWINLGLSTLALAVGGSVFIRGALKAAMMGIVHLDVPIALGMSVAWAGSAWSFLARGGESAYFDTLQIFIALMLLGRLVQRRVIAANRKLVLADDGVGGLVVRVVEADGQIRVRPAGLVHQGDRLIVAPGEVVPVAATLLDRGAELALDWLNGEPEPRAFSPGEEIPAGARNASAAAIDLAAREDFADSHLRSLLAAERLDGDRPLWGRFWDRVSRIYVVAVLAVATLGAALWWPQGPERALEVVVAILVVTCPCALGLATPLAYDIVQSRLRRRGLFIRRLSFLDRALAVKKVVFDKTGTLTLGDLTLLEPAVLRALPAEARAALGHMVARSNHPRSRALSEALGGMSSDGGPEASTRVEEHAGQGLEMRWGATYRLGRPSFAAGPEGRATAADGATVFSRDGQPLAALHFGESLRADARREVRALSDQGVEVYLLSGDEQERVCDIAQSLGVPAHRVRGGASPEDKASFITRINADDTLMIGDGINDAPAFNAAFCAGTPAVDRPTLPARADFFYLGTGLGPIAETLELAHRLRKRIHDNLFLATTYNILAISLALAGLMTPLVCALAMPISSVGIVLATSTTLRRAAAPRASAEVVSTQRWSPAL